jgi:hypothetical protein
MQRILFVKVAVFSLHFGCVQSFVHLEQSIFGIIGCKLSKLLILLFQVLGMMFWDYMVLATLVAAEGCHLSVR